MTRCSILAIVICCVIQLGTLRAAENDVSPTPTPDAATASQKIERRLLADVKQLASDDWEGRGPGTAGIDKAADFIADEFKKAGLKTEIVDGKPFQTFPITVSNKPGDAARNRLIFTWTRADKNGDDAEGPISISVAFTPLSIGGSAKFIGIPVVFAGYGITSPDDKYDDYAGIDVKGKAVILLRHEPQQKNPHSPFEGTTDSRHAALTRKVSNAYQHGAAAVLFVTDVVEIQDKIAAQMKTWKETAEKTRKGLAEAKTDEVVDEVSAYEFAEKQSGLLKKLENAGKQLKDFDSLLPFERGEAGSGRNMPVVHVRRGAIDDLLKESGNPSLRELEKQIDEDLKPRSRELKNVTLSGETHVERVENTVKNVIGVLEGEGPHADETIVIGAHYDHLGRGDHGSLQFGSKDIHNGADDNASGTAVLLEVARMLGKHGKLPRRVVLIAFTGEERGLLGSAYYVHQPLFPLEKTVAMLNMDMVGRLKDEELILYGTGTAKQFDALATKINDRDPFHFKIKREPGGFGPSDHSSFYAMKIPVFHFFTGLHNDYHRPSDDWDKLNIAGMARIGQMVYQTAVEIATTDEAPTYTEAPGEKFGKGGTEKKGARPYFGSIPDLSSNIEGYPLSGVAKGGPADEGGLKANDVIVGVNENKIGNLDDFDSALRKYKSGETIEITVKRGTETLKLKVTLAPPK